MFKVHFVKSSKYVDEESDTVRKKTLELLDSKILRGVYDGNYNSLDIYALLGAAGASVRTTPQPGSNRRLIRLHELICPEQDVEILMRFWNFVEDIASVEYDDADYQKMLRDEDRPYDEPTGAVIDVERTKMHQERTMVWAMPETMLDDDDEPRSTLTEWEDFDFSSARDGYNKIDELISKNPTVTIKPLTSANALSLNNTLAQIKRPRPARKNKRTIFHDTTYEKYVVWRSKNTDDNPVTVAKAIASDPLCVLNLMKHGWEKPKDDKAGGARPESRKGEAALRSFLAFVSMSGFRYEKALEVFEEYRIWEDYASAGSFRSRTGSGEGTHQAAAILLELFGINATRSHIANMLNLR